MLDRILDLQAILERKSVFLFGPRQTGKTTWLRAMYPTSLYINLLSNATFQDYSNRADALESDIKLFQRKPNPSEIIVIDEIQKLPRLLDEVHNQIELNKNLRFILTGSSARKLKREGANLLGGRASWKNFYPLVYPEIKETLQTTADLERRMSIGGLPSIYTSPAPIEDLQDYISLYLNEEIKAEGLVRNYEAFHRFLATAAFVNAKQVNFTQVGSDSQIPPRTVQDYFQILEDTLIGFMLPAFTATPSRKAMTTAKFYLFDTGVANALLMRSEVKAGTSEFGDFFEQFVISEVRAYQEYRAPMHKLFYWRSTSKIEVDLIVYSPEQILAIEIKGKSRVAPKDYRGLVAFAEDYPNARKIVVTLDTRHQLDAKNIEIIPIFQFLQELWAGNLF